MTSKNDKQTTKVTLTVRQILITSMYQIVEVLTWLAYLDGVCVLTHCLLMNPTSKLTYSVVRK